MELRMRKGQFSFDDFLQAQKMLRRMGPLQGLLKMMPGMGQLQGIDVDESKLKRVEAMILSMTPRERVLPHVIDGHRRRRIASGSGSSVQEVNQLLEARKLMEGMMKQMGKGKCPLFQGSADSPELPRPRSVRRPRRRRASAGPVEGNLPDMAIKLRLTRVGSKKNPIYRVVAADSRSPRDGKFLEIVGRYNPQTDPSTIELDDEKIKGWLGKGAQPTEAVARLIKVKGIS